MVDVSREVLTVIGALAYMEPMLESAHAYEASKVMSSAFNLLALFDDLDQCSTKAHSNKQITSWSCSACKRQAFHAYSVGKSSEEHGRVIERGE